MRFICWISKQKQGTYYKLIKILNINNIGAKYVSYEFKVTNELMECQQNLAECKQELHKAHKIIHEQQNVIKAISETGKISRELAYAMLEVIYTKDNFLSNF